MYDVFGSCKFWCKDIIKNKKVKNIKNIHFFCFLPIYY